MTPRTRIKPYRDEGGDRFHTRRYWRTCRYYCDDYPTLTTAKADVLAAMTIGSVTLYWTTDGQWLLEFDENRIKIFDNRFEAKREFVLAAVIARLENA